MGNYDIFQVPLSHISEPTSDMWLLDGYPPSIEQLGSFENLAKEKDITFLDEAAEL